MPTTCKLSAAVEREIKWIAELQHPSDQDPFEYDRSRLANHIRRVVRMALEEQNAQK